MAAVKTSPTASPASSPEAMVPEQAQQPVQKRKGGRKPVYATQEERKMRNRAAQAAFRERRTEYIKHLEATIKHHEEQLSGLQQSSRQAADEVLMLRYKNSLLERILLEKGIDVTAELRTYTTQYDARQQQQQQQQQQPPPPPPPPRSQQQSIIPPQGQPIPPQQPPIIAQAPQLHRPVVGRRPSQPHKRAMMNAGQDAVFIKASPDSLRPVSNHSSPSVATAIPTPPDQSAFQLPPQSAGSSHEFQGIPVAQTYYPSPYQTHMEELEQEYDAELLGNPEEDSASPLDQQPTPDNRDDASITLSAPSVSSPPPPTTQPSVYGIFDTNFESMFATADQPAKHDAGLPDIMRQYSQMPFGFATSNLR